MHFSQLESLPPHQPFKMIFQLLDEETSWRKSGTNIDNRNKAMSCVDTILVPLQIFSGSLTLSNRKKSTHRINGMFFPVLCDLRWRNPAATGGLQSQRQHAGWMWWRQARNRPHLQPESLSRLEPFSSMDLFISCKKYTSIKMIKWNLRIHSTKQPVIADVASAYRNHLDTQWLLMHVSFSFNPQIQLASK